MDTSRLAKEPGLSSATAFVCLIVLGCTAQSLSGETQSPALPARANAADPNESFMRSAFAPLQWSPIGRELAFVTGSDALTPSFPSDWLFPESAPLLRHETKQTLWIAQLGEPSAVPIAETTGKFSAPTWTADASAILIAEFQETSPPSNGLSHGLMRLLRIPRTGPIEIRLQEKVVARSLELSSFHLQSSVASPDGLLAAIPSLDPAGVSLVSLAPPPAATVVEQKPIRRFHGAALPVWSPDGRQLAMFQATQGKSVYSLVGAFVPKGSYSTPLLVIDRGDLLRPGSSPVGKTVGAFEPIQPILWEPNGGSFLAFQSSGAPTNPFDQSRLIIVRGRSNESRVTSLVQLNSPKLAAKGSAHFAFHGKGEQIVVSIPRNDGRSRFDRYSIGNGRREESWHPLENDGATSPIPIGAPACPLSRDRDEGLAGRPQGDFVAFRFGAFHPLAPVGIWDVEKQSTWIPHTNNADALQALAPIVSAVRRTLRNVLPGQTATIKMTLPTDWSTGRPPFNPFDWLPRPEQFEAVKPYSILSVRRLAHHGLALIRDAENSPDLSDESRRRMVEAAAYLHYVREEYSLALRRSQEFAALRPASDARAQLAWAIFQAQCREGLGDAAFGRLFLEEWIGRGKQKLGDEPAFDRMLGLPSMPHNPLGRDLDPYESRLIEIASPKLVDED